MPVLYPACDYYKAIKLPAVQLHINSSRKLFKAYQSPNLGQMLVSLLLPLVKTTGATLPFSVHLILP